MLFGDAGAFEAPAIYTAIQSANYEDIEPQGIINNAVIGAVSAATMSAVINKGKVVHYKNKHHPMRKLEQVKV